jgi:DNA modification methylase
MTQIVHPTNQMVALADIAPHPRNYNRHPAAQVRKLAQSLRKFGQVRSVVVWRSTILAGHGVVEAAKSLNWQHIRADVLPDDYPEHLALAYVAADNELARQGDPDMAQLAAILEEVKDVDAELLEAVGYSDAEFAALLEEVGGEQRGIVDAEPQIDRAEELRKKWRVEPGQLWRLGEHRLICGDCTDAAVVERLMAGEKADMVIADPPYGLSIVAANVSVGGGESAAGMIPSGGKKGRRKGYVGGGEGDSLRHGHYAIEEYQKNKRLGASNGAKPFGSSNVRGSIGAAHVVDVGKYMPIVGDETTDTAIRSVTFYLNAYPQAAQFWFGANYYSEVLKASPCWVVWDKETTGNFADCELAWSNVNRAAKVFRHRWNGMLRDSERGRRWHPTQKPAALAAFLMTEFGKMGDIVIDPFAGAGWTVIGGENTGRRVRAIELVPEYIAVICERWATATGKTPEKVSDGG